MPSSRSASCAAGGGTRPGAGPPRWPARARFSRGWRRGVAGPPVPLNEAADRSEIRVLNPEVEAEIIRRIDAAKQAGDTLGGEVEVIARGVVVGLGSHVSWDRKLDGRLAGMLMSIPAVKGVEIGLGFEMARRPGSEVHDPIESEGLPPRPGERRAGFRR